MGEKFTVNPATGAASMTLPITISPGRSDFAPQLSLSYNSGSGNGPFGFGWTISLASVSRKTEKGIPRYQDEIESDVFILSDAEDLVPAFQKDHAGNWVLEGGQHVLAEQIREADGTVFRIRHYKPRVEGLFARIERLERASVERGGKVDAYHEA